MGEMETQGVEGGVPVQRQEENNVAAQSGGRLLLHYGDVLAMAQVVFL